MCVVVSWVWGDGLTVGAFVVVHDLELFGTSVYVWVGRGFRGLPDVRECCAVGRVCMIQDKTKVELVKTLIVLPVQLSGYFRMTSIIAVEACT